MKTRPIKSSLKCGLFNKHFNKITTRAIFNKNNPILMTIPNKKNSNSPDYK